MPRLLKLSFCTDLFETIELWLLLLLLATSSFKISYYENTLGTSSLISAYGVWISTLISGYFTGDITGVFFFGGPKSSMFFRKPRVVLTWVFLVSSFFLLLKDTLSFCSYSLSYSSFYEFILFCKSSVCMILLPYFIDFGFINLFICFFCSEWRLLLGVLSTWLSPDFIDFSAFRNLPLSGFDWISGAALSAPG